MSTPADGQDFNFNESLVYRFGAYELLPVTEDLRKHGVPVRLPPQPFQVLLALIENAGTLVTREELQRRLWGSGHLTVEFDAGLNRCIRQIRTALSDNADESRFVKTEPRRGYRFVAPIEVDLPGSHTSSRLLVSPATNGQPKLAAMSFAEPEAASLATRSPAVSPRTKLIRRQKSSLRFLVWLAIAATCGGAAYFFYLRKMAEQSEPVSLATVPLATGLGAQHTPTLSPDGRRVAFTWNPKDQDNFDVYVKAIHQAKLLRLTTDKNIDYSAAWSPDGRTIAFCRGSTTPGGAIYIAPAQGGRERKVINLAAIAVPRNRMLTWMPDSRHLIVAETVAGNKPGITSVDVKTSEVRQILTAVPGETYMYPAVSPDGALLAYTNDTGVGVSGIFLQSMSSSRPPQLLRSLAGRQDLQNVNNIQPAWTPDSSHIVFSSNADGQHNLWIAPADSSQAPVPLTGLGNNLEDPFISKTGQLAAVRSNFDRNIWKIETPGATSSTSHIPVLAIASTRDDGEPSVAPNGIQVAFASDRSGLNQIWVDSLDGSEAQPVTNLNSPVTGSPAWSPDGRSIAFDSREAGHAAIYVVSAAGGSPHLLGNPAGSNNMVPAWSPDGRWLYYSSDRSGRMEIWKNASAGGVAEQVTGDGGFAGKLSPDGTLLYFTESKFPSSSLWRLNLETRELRKIAPLVARRAYAPAPAGVYFFTHSPEGSILYFSDTAAGKTSQLFTSNRRIDGSVSLSPDGRYLFYTQADQNGYDLILAPHFWGR